MMEELEVSFKKTLAKFKFDEFADVLSCVFGNDLRWENVTKKLDYLRLDKRAKTVAEVCCLLYKKKRPPKEEALKRLWLLQLYEVSIHSNRQWFGIKLKEPFPDAPPSLENIEKNLSRAYRKELKNATIFQTVVDGFCYIMAVEEKVTKKGSKFLPPVFFAVSVELKSPYAFYTPKQTKSHPVECFCHAVGFQDHRLLALSGDDVEKLFQAAVRKQDGTVALRAPSLQIVPVSQGHIIDMTGYSSRKKYAMNVLPGGTQIKTLTVQSESEWRGVSVIPCLKNDCVIESSMTIQTKKPGSSVDDVLREMIVQGNIKPPLPSWLLEFAQKPRNNIKICSRATMSNSSGGAFERTENRDPSENDDSFMSHT